MDKFLELDKYDRCVANKLVNGRQFTLVWYVEDNKVSHMEIKISILFNQRFLKALWRVSGDYRN